MAGPWEKYAKMAADYMAQQRGARDQALANVTDQYADLVRNPSWSAVTAAPTEDEKLVADNSLAIAQGDAGAIKGKAGQLAMDEASRMARAKAMGFDTGKTYYHGTTAPTDIEQFKLPARDNMSTFGSGVYMTERPDHASNYAKELGIGTEAGKVYPVHVKGNLFETGHWDSERQIAERLGMSEQEFADAVKAIRAKGVPYEDSINDVIRSKGFAGRTLLDAKGNPSQTVVFDPSSIRSKFAAFDPKKAGSGNLSAGIAAAALGAGAAASQSSDADSGPWTKYQKGTQ